MFNTNEDPSNDSEYIDRENKLISDNSVEDLLSNYSQIQRKRIFFDMSHEQVFSIWDTGFLGFSDFNELLQDYSLEVTSITRSLNSYIANMTSEDILFLNVAKYGNYTQNEIGNITDFVDRGGNLIILGEHDILNFTEFQNPLLQHFDMEITTLDIFDNVYNIEINSTIIFNSSYFILNNLSVMATAALNLTGDAFAIANSSHAANYPNVPIMAGYNNSQGGKVFCAIDSEWLWNGNDTFCGFQYGNNSVLISRVLDWFYDTNLSSEIKRGCNVIPEYTLFTAPKNTNFTLNISLTTQFNITTQIDGGVIFPIVTQNLTGFTSWDINVSRDGYVKFTFINSSLSINISKCIYFLEGDYSDKVLFIQNNFSRAITPTPDGLLRFALDLKNRNFSVYATNKIVNYSEYVAVICANPLNNYNSVIFNELNSSFERGTKLIFLNSPFSSLYIEDMMANWELKSGVSPFKVPINNVSSYFGVNFTHRIVCDSDMNSKSLIYYPKLLGNTSTYYNLSCYMPSVLNVSNNYTCELIGYNSSWGEDRSIFGLSGNMGDHNNDINNTCVFAYTNQVLATGMLNYFTNEYYNTSNFFNDFIDKWIRTGKFNRKYKLSSNQTEFHFNDTPFKVFSTGQIKDVDDVLVPNGSLFDVIMSKGAILSDDAAPNIEGTQIEVYNGSVNVTCSTKQDVGLCEISIYNSTSYQVVLSIFLNFSDDGDGDNPQVQINSPSNNTFHSSPPLLNVTAYDANLHYIWYNITGNSTKFLMNNNSAEYLNNSLWNSLPEGEFNISFYANDTWGNINDTYRYTIFKDTISPIITINSPDNESYWNVEPIINVTILESNNDTIWYNVGSTNITLTNNTEIQLDNAIWAGLSEGEFQVFLYANDSAGNINDSIILTLYKDLTPPQISINSPINQSYWNTVPELNLTVYEQYLDCLWYNVTGNSTKMFLTIDKNNTIFYLDSFIWANLSDGWFQISMYANDSIGYLNDSFTLLLCKDLNAPNLTINVPDNNTIWNSAPLLNITAHDINSISIWYNITGNSTKIPLNNNSQVTLNQFLWSDLPQGWFQISFYANDSARNVNNSLSLTLYKDTEAPNITIIIPGGDDDIGRAAPNYNITIIEPNLNFTWYTIDDGLNNFTINETTGIINQTAWENLWDTLLHGDNITIKFYANDSFGIVGFSQITVKKYDPPQSNGGEKPPPTDDIPEVGIMGYDICILITVFSLTSILFIRSRKRNVNKIKKKKNL